MVGFGEKNDAAIDDVLITKGSCPGKSAPGEGPR